MNNWIEHFPYEKPREAQEKIINNVIKQFKSGKKYAVIDCGTGVGKSAIGLTLASYINKSQEFNGLFENGSYFLTTQKRLQEQYEKDFGRPKGSMKSLYSASNYQCSFKKGNDCRTSLQELKGVKKGSPFFKACAIGCKYKAKKKEFLESRESIKYGSYKERKRVPTGVNTRLITSYTSYLLRGYK